MNSLDLCDFDIDVDIGSFLGTTSDPTMVDARWYELAAPRPGRDPALQDRIDRLLRNHLLRAQWNAARRRAFERRRAVRAPLLSRINLGTGSNRMLTTDISMSGLRCSGIPTSPLMDIEFRVPGVPFPIDTRAEVVSYRASRDFPWVGLRFVNIEKPYVEHIARYISQRTRVAA